MAESEPKAISPPHDIRRTLIRRGIVVKSQDPGTQFCHITATADTVRHRPATYSAAIFLIPICISFDTAEKRRYATYLILNRRFSFEF